MDEELRKEIQILNQKIDAVYVSAEKTRKYFLWTLVATVVTFVLPLIAMLFAIPWMMSTVMDQYQGLL